MAVYCTGGLNKTSGSGGSSGGTNTPIAVAITGSGSASYCFATINGTKYSAAANNIEVLPGDTITFSVFGRNTIYYGTVTIDGTTVLTAASVATESYEWTVPDGITSISIVLKYTSIPTTRNGKITVTTA